MLVRPLVAYQYFARPLLDLLSSNYNIILPQDCQVSSWSEWSDCVGQCFVDSGSDAVEDDSASSPRQGRRVRSRAVLSHPGSPASQLACVSSLYETQSCDHPRCYAYEWQVWHFFVELYRLKWSGSPWLFIISDVKETVAEIKTINSQSRCPNVRVETSDCELKFQNASWNVKL